MGLAMLQESARPSPYSGGYLVPSSRRYPDMAQYYLSSLLGFLVVEMIANWGKSISPLSEPEN